MNKSIYLLIIGFIFPISTIAQYYETGQDPAYIRWRQINTENFQIIYPENFETKAQHVAYIFEKVYEYSEENLKQSPRKISVVLHTHTVKSNALVAWAPKRVEFYTTPHQQIYPQDWLEQLAIHEFSHVIQMDRVTEKLPEIFKFILGEQAAAVVVGAYLPFWLLEGDAVCNETAFTKTGRGRLPSFLMENKAQAIEKGIYSLNKAYLGSYKDYVPNHYNMGYLFTGKLKEKYGDDIISKGISQAARSPFSLNPVNSVLKKETGFNQNTLYRQLFTELENEWKNEIEKFSVKEYQKISPEKKVFTNYLYGRKYQGNYYALRWSLNDISRIVRIDSDKKEKIIYTPGYFFAESFSGKENLYIWSENQQDLRWTHSDRSVIVLLNMETGNMQRFHTENKVFAPKISPDLKTFAAVEVDIQNNYYLSVFDLQTGKRKQQYASDDNQFILTPCWDEKGDRIYFIALGKNGKYLASWEPKNNSAFAITEASFANIKNPVFYNDKIYFVASYSGIDNIYAIDLDTNARYQLTSAKFGVDYPSVSEDGKEIVFSNYSSDGFALSRLENKTSEWKQLNVFPQKKFELAENLSAQTKGELKLEKPDSLKYPSKKYSKLAHAFNIHSWAPVYVDADQYEIRPGVSFFSQNKLGTGVFNAGYDYSSSDKTGKFVAGFKYSGWYPVIDINADLGKAASKYYQIKQTFNQQGEVIDQDTILKRYSWKEQNLSLNISLPLSLSSGKYHRLLQPEVIYEYTNIAHDETTPEEFFSGNYQTLGYQLYFHNLQHRSVQNLQSDWGQIFSVSYRHSPKGEIDFGNITALQSYLYFPGIKKNHGIRIYNGYQEKSILTRNSFSNIIRTPRGFQSVQNTSMYSFASDYRLPLFYPDLSIGKLAYIKRIKASVFYDYAQLQIPLFSEDGNYQYSVKGNMQSVGIELQSDFHVLRFFAPMELGIRSIYRSEYKDMQFELLFSIDFSGL